MNAAVTLLEAHGLAPGRPVVGHIITSRHATMRELIATASAIPMLFVSDPRRTAILLLGGSKTNQWDEWSTRAAPVADDL